MVHSLRYLQQCVHSLIPHQCKGRALLLLSSYFFSLLLFLRLIISSQERENHLRQSVVRAIADQSRDIRIPIHVQEQTAKIKKAEKELQQSLERKPTSEEIAEHLGKGMTAEKVKEILNYAQAVQSLDESAKTGYGILWDSRLRRWRQCKYRIYRYDTGRTGEAGSHQ